MKTYIETYDGEKYTIDMDYLDFCKMEVEKKKAWEEYLRIANCKTSIKWNSIKKTSWSKLTMSIDEEESDKILKLDKSKIIEKTPEERKAMADNLRKIAWVTFEARQKKFLEERKQILMQLSKREVYFQLETTINKLEDYKKLKIAYAKNKNN